MLITKKGLENRMVELEKEMNIPFEDIGHCIQKHNDDIFDLKHAVGDLENEVNSKMDVLESDIYDLNEFKDNMEYYDFDNMESSISNMEYEFGDMNDKMEELQEMVEDTNYGINDVKNELEYELEQRDDKINDLEWEIEDLKDKLTTISMEYDKLMEVVEKMGKVIDVLAVGK